MRIWAIADLHLSFGVPNKKMDFFGKEWKDHDQKIAADWLEKVSKNDIVLIPGDISWGLKWKDAYLDLEWIDKLPGKKILIKGNHDYWWPSLKKLNENLPPSLHAIHNNAITIGDVSIGGSRLWDTKEYSFLKYIEIKGSADTLKKTISSKDEDRFNKELLRLESSLQLLNSDAKIRIAMAHYPPISRDLSPSKTSLILEKYKIDHCCFGHLHSVKKGSLNFGKTRGVHYHFTACDYLDFKLKLISSL